MTEAGDPHVTIVVPCYNASRFIAEQLDSIYDQIDVQSTECIVINDGSIDGTMETVQGWILRHPDADVRLITRQVRGGPNASRNVGLREAKAEYILFVDGDDVVAAGWFGAMMRAKRENALLTGRVQEFELRSTGAKNDLPGDRQFPHRWNGLMFAHGGNMGGMRSLFVCCGGFDENILIGGSEIEFAVRLQRESAGVVVGVLDSSIYYRLPTSNSGVFLKNFSRERGYAYIAHIHRGFVSHTGWKIGAAQVFGGVRTAITSREGAARRAGREKVARGLGRLLGGAVWRTRYAISCPEPVLLGGAERQNSAGAP